MSTDPGIGLWPKRTAVRKKRPGPPRRGRIIDKDFLAWMHTQECVAACKFLVSQCRGPVTAHHVRRFGEPKNDRRLLPLCEAHHLYEAGQDSIERLGKAKFQERFGINIEHRIAVFNERYVYERSRAK